MMASARPAVVWMPNVETFLLLVNLTEEGTRYQARAVNPVRRAAWLKYDGKRRAPAVTETAALLKEGFWLDSIAEIALAAEAPPKAGFSYPLSRETAAKAGADGRSRLNRYLELTAAFALDAGVADFFRVHGDAYRGAVSELETALGDAGWLDHIQNYFGTTHRSYLAVASLLMPAGFTFGISLSTPEGPLAVYLTGPFIEPDGGVTFASASQAVESAEREFIHAFLRPVISRGQAGTRPFKDAFNREKDAMAKLGYRDPMECLRDHVANAIQARLMARRGERDAAAALLSFDAGNGYLFTAGFAHELEDYELHRTDFPDFQSFFPRLMDSVR
jgi:hypothetical protein